MGDLSLYLLNRVDQSQAIDLQWNNLSVTIRNAQSRKLNGVTVHDFETPLTRDDSFTSDRDQPLGKCILAAQTGFARRGELTAIMGPSGAGKTTMLACISQRLGNSRQTIRGGSISANGIIYDADEFCDFGVFVMQSDVLLAAMTVRESIMFSAQLRLSLSQQETNEKVESVLKELQLTQCQHTLIGNNVIKGISGGEKKRTCIGVEIVSNAPVIVLDEPTSGLDSFTAFVIINILKRIAAQQHIHQTLRNQRTVLFTIHQPSSDIIQLIDRLIILNGGQTVYQGLTRALPDYMTQMGISMPRYSNPCDIFMCELANQKTFLTNQNYQDILQPEVLQEYEALELKVTLPRVHKRNTFTHEFKVLSRRHLVNYIRAPGLLRARILITIFLIVFPTILYWKIANSRRPADQPPFSEASLVSSYILNLSGTLFFLGIVTTFSAMGPLIQLFPVEREVFMKEENTRQYRVISYFISKVLIEVPFAILTPICASSVIYFSLALKNDSSSFLYFTLGSMLVAFCGNGLGIMTGSLFSDAKRSVAMAPMILMPLFVFGGQFSNLSTLPAWISWFQYISPFKYYQEIVLSSQFSGITYQATYLGQITLISPLKELGMEFGLNESIGVLAGMGIGFHILSFLLLKLLVSRISV